MISKYFLVSRFNWPHPVWKTRTRQEYLDWLNLRVDIFSRFTLNSYRNLYNKPDLWILLVDKNIEHVIDDLYKLLDGINFKFLFPVNKKIRSKLQGSSSEKLTGITLSLQDYISNNFEFPLHIITTRLDTDDLISNDYFARLKSLEMNDTGKLLVSFPGGANYNAIDNKFFYSSFPDNPFISLAERIEKPSEMMGVYYTWHSKIVDCVDRTIYLRSSHPMWASVIHNHNMANQSLSKLNYIALGSQEALFKKFGIRNSMSKATGDSLLQT